MKSTWVKVNGTWKQVKNVWTKVNGDWKQRVMPKGKISGSWKELMSYIVNWRVEEAVANYSNITPMQVDGDGNSYFRTSYPGSIFESIVKYSVDGKKIATKPFKRSSAVTEWGLFGDYIYFQYLDGSYSPIGRININTLEESMVVEGMYSKVNYIYVDEAKDLIVVGREDGNVITYKLSTGYQLLALNFPTRLNLIDYDYDYYFEEVNSSQSWLRVYRYDKNVLKWSYYSPICTKYKRLGMDVNYFYYLFKVGSSTWEYHKISRQDGSFTKVSLINKLTEITTGSYFQIDHPFVLNTTGEAFLAIFSGVLYKYSVQDFTLLMSKDLQIGQSVKTLVSKLGCLYYTTTSSLGIEKHQLWGKQQEI